MPSETAADQQIGAVVSVVRDTLGRITLGAWLYGSATSSGLRPDSDLDFLVVTDQALTAEQKRALVDRLTPLSARRLRPPGWRPVELTVVVQSDVRPWRYPPRFDFQYGEWLRSHFEAGELAPWPATNPDVAMLLTMVRHAARPLVGPPPAELLDPVPRRDLQRAMVEELDGLLADLVPDTRNVLLTLARMWCTLDTGQMRSKDAAAEWAMERLPAGHRAVLERARHGYQAGGDEAWTEWQERAEACAAEMTAHIRHLATRL